MTTADAKSKGRSALCFVLGILHGTVGVLVLSSLYCGFEWWIDLRLLGGIGSVFVKLLWACTVLIITWRIGLRLAGWQKPAWINSGWAPGAAKWLLVPTYFVIACLIVNTVWFYQLRMHDGVDSPVPMTLLVAILLGVWAFLTREWIRRGTRMPAIIAATRATQVCVWAYVAVVLVVTLTFYQMQNFARPVTATVDLAVVLGNRVLPDGTASVTLRDRTLAAVSLYQRGLARHLYLSGSASPNEPEAMRRVCLDHGVPEEAITLDPVGDNTRATAFNTVRFMREHGLASVAVCTDQYHLYRSVWSFRECGVEAYTATAVPGEWRCVDPRAIGREMIGIAVYRLMPNYRRPVETRP
ncbi:MAG: YdcF family protein [Phycisphaerales bacterium]|nr:YdcF family protein [Phycisphaerales bacterium]